MGRYHVNNIKLINIVDIYAQAEAEGNSGADAIEASYPEQFDDIEVLISDSFNHIKLVI